MLRITIHESAGGKRSSWKERSPGLGSKNLVALGILLAASLGSKELHLDLRDVAFVDAKGRQLLRDIYQKTNASFLADSPLTRYFADDAMQQSPKNGEEGV